MGKRVLSYVDNKILELEQNDFDKHLLHNGFLFTSVCPFSQLEPIMN